MSSTIITALISGLCVAIPSVLATISSSKTNNNLVIYRINQLEDKVNKHNNLIERMTKVEMRIQELEHEIKK